MQPLHFAKHLGFGGRGTGLYYRRAQRLPGKFLPPEFGANAALSDPLAPLLRVLPDPAALRILGPLIQRELLCRFLTSPAGSCDSWCSLAPKVIARRELLPGYMSIMRPLYTYRSWPARLG